MTNKIQLKDMLSAQATAALAAHNLATTCALQTHQRLPAAALRVGDMLGLQYITAKAAGLDTPESEQARANGVLQLRYALGNGVKDAKMMLAELNRFGGGAGLQGAHRGKPKELTAEALVRAFEANRTGFDLKYAGKILEVTGPVVQIIDNSVSIRGIDRGDPNKQNLWDDVYCNFEHPAAIADLMPHMLVHVVGHYDPHTDNGFTITLDHCRLVK